MSYIVYVGSAECQNPIWFNDLFKLPFVRHNTRQMNTHDTDSQVTTL